LLRPRGWDTVPGTPRPEEVVQMGFRIRSRMLFVFAVALVAVLGLSAGQASANHVQCGDTITQDTTLDSDLIGCPGDGIVIGADGVTLDLNGHTVSGRPPTGTYWGIVSIGHAGVTIKNGTVKDFDYGIEIYGASRSHVLGVDVHGLHRGEAIGLFSSHDSVVEDNVAHGICLGIHLIGADRNVIRRNEASGFCLAIDLRQGSDDNIVEGHSLLSGSGIASIRVLDGSGNVIRRNVVAHDDFGGILISGDRTLVEGNTVSDTHRGDGIDVGGANNVV
jgi:parallel beta-helix repeat protein